MVRLFSNRTAVWHTVANESVYSGGFIFIPFFLLCTRKALLKVSHVPRNNTFSLLRTNFCIYLVRCWTELINIHSVIAVLILYYVEMLVL